MNYEIQEQSYGAVLFRNYTACIIMHKLILVNPMQVHENKEDTSCVLNSC